MQFHCSLYFVEAPGVLALIHGSQRALPHLGEELRHVLLTEGGVEEVLLTGHEVGKADALGELSRGVEQGVKESHCPWHQLFPQL